MVLLEFSMSPLDKGESVGKYVSRSLKIIDESGVDYRLNPMGTVLEGEWDDVITPELYTNYKAFSVRSNCLHASIVEKADYNKGWVDKWPDLLKAPLTCQ